MLTPAAIEASLPMHRFNFSCKTTLISRVIEMGAWYGAKPEQMPSSAYPNLLENLLLYKAWKNFETIRAMLIEMCVCRATISSHDGSRGKMKNVAFCPEGKVENLGQRRT